mmetsp:Transcript_31380/g.34733  ORF Transcript_31380/g.34733 Transcript_31380/m.34733 type:complete len:274 (+) Transcript_31380:194-1015(+)
MKLFSSLKIPVVGNGSSCKERREVSFSSSSSEQQHDDNNKRQEEEGFECVLVKDGKSISINGKMRNKSKEQVRPRKNFKGIRRLFQSMSKRTILIKNSFTEKEEESRNDNATCTQNRDDEDENDDDVASVSKTSASTIGCNSLTISDDDDDDVNDDRMKPPPSSNKQGEIKSLIPSNKNENTTTNVIVTPCNSQDEEQPLKLVRRRSRRKPIQLSIDQMRQWLSKSNVVFPFKHDEDYQNQLNAAKTKKRLEMMKYRHEQKQPQYYRQKQNYR